MKQENIEQLLELPAWMSIGEREISTPDVYELSLRPEYMIPKDNGALTRDGLCEVFPQIKEDCYSRGLSDEEASKSAWRILTNFVLNRVVPKVKGPLFEQTAAIKSEVKVMNGWVSEFMKNFSENRLGMVYPKREAEMVRT